MARQKALVIDFITVLAFVSLGGGAALASGSKATSPPPEIFIHCPYADFSFNPNGNVADIADRTIAHGEEDMTMGDVRVSPTQVSVKWERVKQEMLGPRLFRRTYLINLQTGDAQTQTLDYPQGMEPIVAERSYKCDVIRK